MSKINSIAFAVTAVMFAIGCSEDPITTIDRSSDCSSICNKYKDCIDSDYDVDACKDDCTDMKSNDETAKIDDCQDCLKGENSCVDKAFKCTSECAGIVP